MHRLREFLILVNTRLDALEGKQGLPAAPPPPVSIPAYLKPEVITPLPKATPIPAEKIPPPEEAPAEVKEKPAPAKPREWEQVLAATGWQG
jgi:hypothetical protein